MSSIQLKTEMPGPKSRAMLARRASAVPTGLGKATDVVVERTEGALVHDVDGNTFIDFVGGIGALAVGHCPPDRRRGDARGGAKGSCTCARWWAPTNRTCACASC